MVFAFSVLCDNTGLDIRKNSCTEKAVRCGVGLPREVAECPSLEVFEPRGRGMKGSGLVVGLGRSGSWLELMISKVLSNPNDSVIVSLRRRPFLKR